MTQRTDGVPPDCMDTAALTAYMGWKDTAVARTLNNRAKKRREQNDIRPADLPAPAGHIDTVRGPRPYWRKADIDAWRAVRPGTMREQNAPAEGLRRCNTCQEVKPLAAFYMYKDTRTDPPRMVPTARCRQCANEGNQAYYEANYETRRAYGRAYSKKHRRRDRAAKYGLTAEQLTAMETEQEGRCLICHEEPGRLVIDHCHDTGAVRGLLCDLCNKGLGAFRDNPRRLAAALAYLIGSTAA